MALKDIVPVGWQETERGHTGMATVMYEVQAGRVQSVYKVVWIGAGGEFMGREQGFDKSTVKRSGGKETRRMVDEF